MSKQAHSKMFEQRRTMQWLHWGLLRRCEGYKEAVEYFLAATRELSRVWAAQRPSHPELPVSVDSQMFRDYFARLEECEGHINACQEIVETYERLARWLGPELTQKEREALDAGHGEDYWRLQQEVLLVVEGCLSHNLWGCADHLREFQERWGVRFPLDPGLPAVVWELLLRPPEAAVRLISWTPEAATFEVSPNRQRKRLHAELDMHLDALAQLPSMQQRTKRDKDNLQGISEPRRYYTQALEAFDFDQQDWTGLAIAERLWEKEVVGDRKKHGNEYSHFPSIKKAYDRVNTIKRLITNIQK